MDKLIKFFENENVVNAFIVVMWVIMITIISYIAS